MQHDDLVRGATAGGPRRCPPTRRRLVLMAGMSALMTGLAGCTAAPARARRDDLPPEILRSSVRLQKEYLLFEGDQIEVSVWRVPEVSRTVVIRPDGNISLPLVQDMKAAGRTPRELAADLRQALSRRLLDPEVNVIALTVRQPTVYVLGDVRAPGAFPLRGAVTAAQALAAAGGTLRSATEADTTLIRLSREGFLEAIPLQGGGVADVSGTLLALAATPLQSDDIVFVPESGRSQVVRVFNDLLLPFQIYLNYKILQEAT